MKTTESPADEPSPLWHLFPVQIGNLQQRIAKAKNEAQQWNLALKVEFAPKSLLDFENAYSPTPGNDFKMDPNSSPNIVKSSEIGPQMC